MAMLQTDTLVDQYFHEIEDSVGLSAADEIEVAGRIRDGDEDALSSLVNANLRFVVSVAKGYQNLGLPLSDLINEGNLGLMVAARRFDGSKGFKFISYAVWWIRQSILQALAEQSRIVRLPLNRIGELTRVNKVLTKLEQKLGRPPEVEEIAEELDVDRHGPPSPPRSTPRLPGDTLRRGRARPLSRRPATGRQSARLR